MFLNWIINWLFAYYPSRNREGAVMPKPLPYGRGSVRIIAANSETLHWPGASGCF